MITAIKVSFICDRCSESGCTCDLQLCEQGYRRTCDHHSFLNVSMASPAKELPEQLRIQIVRLHKDGRGYKSNSRLLNISWNTVAAVVTRYRKSLKNDAKHNLLFMQPCIEKQIGKISGCFWLGTRIICGNWCFSDCSDSVKDIASQPLWTASKKKNTAHKSAQNSKIKLCQRT